MRAGTEKAQWAQNQRRELSSSQENAQPGARLDVRWGEGGRRALGGRRRKMGSDRTAGCGRAGSHMLTEHLDLQVSSSGTGSCLKIDLGFINTHRATEPRALLSVTGWY